MFCSLLYQITSRSLRVSKSSIISMKFNDDDGDVSADGSCEAIGANVTLYKRLMAATGTSRAQMGLQSCQSANHRFTAKPPWESRTRAGDENLETRETSPAWL